ncbi:MAG: CsiV family protein [bacterium]
MNIRLPLIALTALLLCISNGAFAADLEDQLQARWFEIEMLVFERLDVLDVNTDEQLTLHRARRWPHNLMDMIDPSAPRASAAERSLADLLAPGPYCLGYPQLREEDPPHPLLAKNNSFGDVRNAVPAAAGEAPDELAANGRTAQQNPTGQAELPVNEPVLAPTARSLVLADIAAYEATLFASSYTWLPTTALNEDVKSINRQRTLRPLIHRRWRQPVPEREAPAPVYIELPLDQRNPATATGYPRVEGFVDVTVSRYLHFAATLWYHADTLGAAPIMMPLRQAYASPRQSFPDEPYMQLKESRRLRSGELHYLDHPKFGVLVIIEPVAPPRDLQDAWLQLQTSGR